MLDADRTTTGEAATDLILSVFRANGRLLDAGDRLSATHGLTSARWQVLGAITLAGRPLTVPQIARRMGLARQSVHTTVGRLVREGLLELGSNDEHRRSSLVRITDAGRDTYSAVDRAQASWVNEVTRGISRSDLATARAVLDELASRLEARREVPRPRGADLVAGKARS
jgi:DNA-binding MarR family transcriptional regulator